MGQKVPSTSLRLQKADRHFDSCWYTDFFYTHLISRELTLRNLFNPVLRQVGNYNGHLSVSNLPKRSIVNFFCYRPTPSTLFTPISETPQRGSAARWRPTNGLRTSRRRRGVANLRPILNLLLSPLNRYERPPSPFPGGAPLGVTPPAVLRTNNTPVGGLPGLLPVRSRSGVANPSPVPVARRRKMVATQLLTGQWVGRSPPHNLVCWGDPQRMAPHRRLGRFPTPSAPREERGDRLGFYLLQTSRLGGVASRANLAKTGCYALLSILLCCCVAVLVGVSTQVGGGWRHSEDAGGGWGVSPEVVAPRNPPRPRAAGARGWPPERWERPLLQKMCLLRYLLVTALLTESESGMSSKESLLHTLTRSLLLNRGERPALASKVVNGRKPSRWPAELRNPPTATRSGWCAALLLRGSQPNRRPAQPSSRALALGVREAYVLNPLARKNPNRVCVAKRGHQRGFEAQPEGIPRYNRLQDRLGGGAAIRKQVEATLRWEKGGAIEPFPTTQRRQRQLLELRSANRTQSGNQKRVVQIGKPARVDWRRGAQAGQPAQRGRPALGYIESTLSNKLKSHVALLAYSSRRNIQSSLFFAEEIIYYLKRGVTPQKTIRHLLWRVPLKTVRGVRVTYSGCFRSQGKRSQRANTKCVKLGETPLNALSRRVDFACKSVLTRSGLVGIKVWICYRP